MSQSKVLQEKEKGNECFGRKDYLGAIEHYTKALELDPTNLVVLSNRAQCFICLERYFSLILSDISRYSLLYSSSTQSSRCEDGQRQSRIVTKRSSQTKKRCCGIPKSMCVERLHTDTWRIILFHSLVYSVSGQ